MLLLLFNYDHISWLYPKNQLTWEKYNNTLLTNMTLKITFFISIRVSLLVISAVMLAHLGRTVFIWIWTQAHTAGKSRERVVDLWPFNLSIVLNTELQQTLNVKLFHITLYLFFLSQRQMSLTLYVMMHYLSNR